MKTRPRSTVRFKSGFWSKLLRALPIQLAEQHFIKAMPSRADRYTLEQVFNAQTFNDIRLQLDEPLEAQLVAVEKSLHGEP
jgi:hypothetical protein